MIFISFSIIQDVIEFCKADPDFAYAYYFFDGRDAQTQRQLHDKFIRSLVLQLSDRTQGTQETPSALVDLYKQYDSGHREPPTEELQKVLESILRRFKRVYMVIDALDECIEREKFCLWLTQISSVEDSNLHIAITGRPERDIDDHMRSLDYQRVDIADGLNKADIATYIDQVLTNDVKLNKWGPEVHDTIKQALMSKAQGMFVLSLSESTY